MSMCPKIGGDGMVWATTNGTHHESLRGQASRSTQKRMQWSTLLFYRPRDRRDRGNVTWFWPEKVDGVRIAELQEDALARFRSIGRCCRGENRVIAMGGKAFKWIQPEVISPLRSSPLHSRWCSSSAGSSLLLLWLSFLSLSPAKLCVLIVGDHNLQV
jgi:hypothetical protein